MYFKALSRAFVIFIFNSFHAIHFYRVCFSYPDHSCIGHAGKQTEIGLPYCACYGWIVIEFYSNIFKDHDSPGAGVLYFSSSATL